MQKADDLEMVSANMVPPLLEAVLLDYNRNVLDAREAEVLSVMTTIIHKLHVSRRRAVNRVEFVIELRLTCAPDLDGRQDTTYHGKRFRIHT